MNVSMAYRRVLTSSVVILILGVVVNISGLIKELFVAQHFGTGNQLDIFTMGLAIPLFLNALFGTAIGSVVVPAYVKSKAEHQSQAFIADVMVLTLLLSVFLTFISVGASFLVMPYMASGFDADKLQRSMEVGVLLSPLIMIQNVSVFLDGLLNSDNSSYYNNLIAIFIPLGTILVIFAAQSESELVLCVGLYLGCSIKLLLQILKFLRLYDGFAFRGWHTSLLTSHKGLIKEFFWIVFSSVILGILPIIAQSYAASLHAGVVSSMNYANKLIGIGLIILSNVITVVFLPFISKEIVKDRQTGVRLGVNLALMILILLLISLVPFYFALHPLVSLILERGKFDSHSTREVVDVLKYMIWYVPFYVSGGILARLVVALNKSSVFIVGNIISLALFALVGKFAVQRLDGGGIGVTLTVVYAMSFVYLLLQVQRGRRTA